MGCDDLGQLCEASPDLGNNQNVHWGLGTNVAESQRLQSSQTQSTGSHRKDKGYLAGTALPGPRQYKPKESLQYEREASVQ